MTQIRTVDFLPEIFRTSANSKFLSATVDQLIQEPNLKRIQGYIGRAKTAEPGEYIVEPNAQRRDYQLEPAVITLTEDNSVDTVVTYPETLAAIQNYGAYVNRPDRLFDAEYYAWDPMVDFDKLINFSQYYWLPSGPDSVNVSASAIPLSTTFEITAASGYTVKGFPGANPKIYVLRNGEYRFAVNQPGRQLFIQAAPGVNGTFSFSPNISSRNVFGVENNGVDTGEIIFRVPSETAQDMFFTMPVAAPVDLATDLLFTDLQNIAVDAFIAEHSSIDGITELDGLSIVFKSTLEDGWFANSNFGGIFAPDPGYGTVMPVPATLRYNAWQIRIETVSGVDYIRLFPHTEIVANTQFKILYGIAESNRVYYKTSSNSLLEVPLLTANLTTLYYQDATDPTFFGEIEIVDQAGNQTINIDADIHGQPAYTSGNGVTFTNGLKVQFRGNVIPESFQDQSYYVEGVGTGIVLIPADELVTPEKYTASESERYDSMLYDELPYEATLNRPRFPDYLTINRAARDRNAWSRSNRWTHINVIDATAEYNRYVPVLDNSMRAARPIVEFNANLQLFNYGNTYYGAVDVIDFAESDALSSIAGILAEDLPTVDGFTLQQGTRIIFAADADAQVRNVIYEIRLEQLDPDAPNALTVTLVPVSTVAANGSVVCARGLTLQGITFYYSGAAWTRAQQKTSINQAPLFALYDTNGVALNDQTTYISSSFAGSKLFSYAVGNGAADKVLGIPLRYQSINNIGDIVFEPYMFTDTFAAVQDGTGTTISTAGAYVVDYATGEFKNGWQIGNTTDLVSQIFTIAGGVASYVLDVPAISADSVRVYKNSTFVPRADYTATVVGNTTEVAFAFESSAADTVEIVVYSVLPSQVGRYSVPLSLENNSFNETPSSFTLGALRRHYSTAAERLVTLTGTVLGQSNVRDLGNIVPYATSIIQHAAPAALVPALTAKTPQNIFAAVDYVAQEYEKIKFRILDAVARDEFVGMTAAQILDSVIDDLTAGKTDRNPFYWTDMLPSKIPARTTRIVVTTATSPIIDTTEIYGDTAASYKGVLVYLNDQILTRGKDYILAADGPRLTLLTSISVGDVIVVKEYTETYGSCIPDTPTKLGLFPAALPEKYLDTTYRTPQDVIRGHDGSITIAFNDIRDEVLLEFETRIYNNLKVQAEPNIVLADVMSTVFRDAEYTADEVGRLLEPSYISWLAWNRIDPSIQDFDMANEFSWNYTGAVSKLDAPLASYWRSIYYDLYDTDTPHTRPWEMIGLLEKPSWWEEAYGPLPYTSGNQVLWDDMAAGFIADPANPRHDPRYARPGLQQVIPVDGQGNLLSPYRVVVKDYDQTLFRADWRIQGGSPAWSAWRKSSAWPYAVQRALMATKPAAYFAENLDLDRYTRSAVSGQFQFDTTGRLQLTKLALTNNEPRHSYINWLADLSRRYGVDAAAYLTDRFSQLDIRLAYRAAGFTDKRYMRVLVEQTSPTSTNSSAVLPDESYSIKLHTNVAEEIVDYSGIIIQRTDSGFVVYGFNDIKPYFKIYPAILNSNYVSYQIGNTTIKVARDFEQTERTVPYGNEYSSIEATVNFIAGYGKYLESRGFAFSTVEGNVGIDWATMGREFVTWAKQSWPVGSLLSLNPAANRLEFARDNLVVDSLLNLRSDQLIVDQAKRQVKPADTYVNREGHQFSLETATGNLVSSISLNLVSMEHVVIFDNKSVFGDVIYEPVTGLRQARLRLSGYITDGWSGIANSPGFMINEDTVTDWRANAYYSKGQIVRFKNQFWSAAEMIQPAETFDFSKWLPSDYDQSHKGLLANIATKAEQARSFYNNRVANLEQDNDLLSFGLIGFRPRTYLNDISLDDISQVGVYSDFIASKGTQAGLELFADAQVGADTTGYEIFENWAIQSATYGATANRKYVEVVASEDRLQANPALIQFALTATGGTADQIATVQNLHKSSYPVASASVFPTVAAPEPSQALPTAGFARIDETDIQLFSLDNVAELSVALRDISYGTIIWVAKVNRHEWDIYKAVNVGAQLVKVQDALNGFSVFSFDNCHELVAGDLVVVKEFDARVDRAYRVLSVLSGTEVAVELSLPNQVTEITGAGAVFVLRSQLVNTLSEIGQLFEDRAPARGDRVWVKDVGNNKWGVVERTEPYSIEGAQSLTYFPNNAGTGTFGAAAQVSASGDILAIADPARVLGGAFVYGRYIDSYLPGSFVTLQAVPDVAGLGHSVALRNSSWLAMGAPASNGNAGYVAVYQKYDSAVNYSVRQLLVGAPAAEFGYSIAASTDAKWLFVGAPGAEQVTVYNRVDVAPTVILDYVADGTTDTYALNFAATNALQVLVLVDNAPTSAFALVGDTVVLNTVPAAGLTVRVAKRMVADETLATYPLTQLFADYSGPESVTLMRSGGPLRYGIDYTIDGSHVITATDSGIDFTIEVGSHYKLAAVVTSPTVSFGKTVACSANGDHLLVGAPEAQVDTFASAGRVFVYARNDRKEWQQEANSYIVKNVLGTGFTLVQELTQAEPAANAEFGHSIAVCPTKCSLYVGAPGARSNAGVVERFVNGGRVTGAVASALLSSFTWPAGATVVINGFEVDTGATVDEFIANIHATNAGLPVPNVRATVVDDRLVLQVISKNSASAMNLLSVLPATDADTAAIETMGLESFASTQTIESPYAATNARFGHAVEINSTSTMLFVASPGANARLNTTFDGGEVSFDYGTTTYSDTINNAGAVYLFNLLPDASVSQFVFGQQIVNNTTVTGDGYGTAITLNDRNELIITSPTAAMYRQGSQFYDKTTAIASVIASGNNSYNFYGPEVDDGSTIITHDEPSGFVKITEAGRFTLARSTGTATAWQVVRQQRDIVDIARINRVYAYNKATHNVVADLDYIDPIQGKILGVARQNIDYILSADPARYNAGPAASGRRWSRAEVGRIWWNTENCRYHDYYDPDARAAAAQWGRLFPGSTADVYEWIESAVPPAEYNGVVFDPANFSVESTLNAARVFETQYYFWAKNTTTVNRAARKTMSAATVARYIDNPRASGIPYVALVNESTVALYNFAEYLVSNDIVIHFEFEDQATFNNVHVEYDLIAEGMPTAFLSARLFRKMLDSFCGTDTLGNAVPDRTLPPADLYGVAYRPRQSMFKDRYAALRNYITRVNSILIQTPIRETKVLNLLNSVDPVPSAASQAWNKRLLTRTELAYQDFAGDGVGYKYLVETDDSNFGRWAIYEVVAIPQDDSTVVYDVALTRVQYFDTRDYWDYVDWYAAGYSSSIKPTLEVPYASELSSLSAPEYTVARVKMNGTGHWELYERQSGAWVRIAVEKGTIQIAAKIYDYSLGNYGFDLDVYDAGYFDQEPVMETRRVIEAINEELLVDELLVERNAALMLMFNYILTEQKAPEWLTKTSLIDVEHTVRQLRQDEYYKKDNQEFVSDYINEVKPYHVKVREFSAKYSALDGVEANFTDFDVPSYYDSATGKFISPVYTTNNGTNVNEHPADNAIWTTRPWSDWFENFSLSLDGVLVANRGSGYTTRPVIIVEGETSDPAELVALLNSAGEVIGAQVIHPGSGYQSTPVLIVDGGNGTGARLTAVMSPTRVRSFETDIKLDRCEYDTTVVVRDASSSFNAFNVALVDGKYYRLYDDTEIAVLGLNKASGLDAGSLFQVENWDSEREYQVGDLVTAGGIVYKVVAPAAADTPITASEFMQVYAIEIQVDRLSAADRTMQFYTQQSNPDIGQLIPGTRFDAVWVYGQSWNPDDAVYEYDTYFESEFGETEEVAVDGAAFIDAVHAHAPEELMPGIAFDTMDLVVEQRPGADWLGQGFAFEMMSVSTAPLAGEVSFADLVQVPSLVRVADMATNTVLAEGSDYQINWIEQTVTGLNVAADVRVTVYGIGGGNQLYKTATVLDTSLALTVPAALIEITSVVGLINGTLTEDITVTSAGPGESTVTFNSAVSGDYVAMTVFGASSYQAAMPVIEHVAGVTGQSVYSLQNSLAYTNPINAIVEKNGIRLRPADTATYSPTTPTTVFAFSAAAQLYLSEIYASHVEFYVNGIRQQALVNYNVDLINGTVITTAPVTGEVSVAITTRADYLLAPTQLTLTNTTAASGDLITVLNWSDTRELRMSTHVFEGPTTLGVVQSYPFDSVGFSRARPGVFETPTQDLGPFDYYEDLTVTLNRFNIGRSDVTADRVWVTKNGLVLRPVVDYTVAGTEVVLSGSLIAATDVVVVTAMTNNTVPAALNYRIFQDMRGQAGIYRMTANTTLASSLTATSTSIKVTNAAALADPAASERLYGVIIVNGERITYRTRNTATNILSGLRRGTAGTGANAHAVDSEIFDLGRPQQLPQSYSQSLYTTTGPLNQQLANPAVRFLLGF